MANSRSPRRRGRAASQLSRIQPARGTARAAAISPRRRPVHVSDDAALGSAPAGSPDSDVRVGPENPPSTNGGLFSLAVRARSRAWLVPRWVGVAAPAQRYVRGMAQRVAARIPDQCGCRRGCRATVRMLRHSGSGCGRCGLIEIAGLPPSRGQVPRGRLRSPGAGLLYGTRSAVGNPSGHRRPRCRRVA
jgi:hypothetical protein